MDEKKIEEQFYMAALDKDGSYDLPQLLRNVAAELRKEEKPLHVTELYLKQGSSDGSDAPFLFVQYEVETIDEIEARRQNLEWTATNKVSPAVKIIEHIVDPHEGAKLNGFVRRLPQGEAQHDASQLLEATADTLAGLRVAEVLDITYHDVSDQDALDHPFIRVYYLSRI